jgi:hypothetical protein
MRVNFRQGIINYQHPSFLQVNRTSIDLVVNNIPLLFTIASGSKNYLFAESHYVPRAWPTLIANTDQWIYIDYDPRTATRTFGITRFIPQVSMLQPPNPVVDTHWFDTINTQMNVWNGIRWIPKIRIIIANIKNGVIPISVSQLSPIFSGTQIGDNSTVLAGTILFNNQTGAPLTDNSGQFITTEDNLRTENANTSMVKFANTLIEVSADQPMTAHTLVTFSSFGHIVHANSFTASHDVPYGIILEDVITGAITNVVTTGAISSNLWDWSHVDVNTPLYCDNSGTLTVTPVIPQQIYSALVIDTNTILLGPPRQIFTGNNTGPIEVSMMTDVTAGIARLSVPAVSVNDPIVVGNNDPRLTASVPLIGGTMSGILTLSGNPVNPLEATPKQYVDSKTTSLHLLEDVHLSTPLVGQFLSYNGTDWVNVNSSAAATLPDIILAGTASKVTFNTKGLITGTSNLLASDIPNLNWSKITNTPTTVSGYSITDVYTKVLSDNRYLQTTLTLNFAGDFTASGPIGGTITATLANSGVTPGSYNNVTVNSKGLVINGSDVLYLMGNETITVTGDVTGTGTTSLNLTLNTVPISKGGTGQTTVTAAINSLLPSQSTNATKALVTDGTNISWQDVVVHPATTSVLGGIIVGSGLNVDVNGVLSVPQIETISSGDFVVPGDCVAREMVIYGISTSAAPIDLLLGGVTRLLLSDNSSWGYDITVVGTRVDGTIGNGTWRFSGNIHRGVGTITTTITPNPYDIIVSVSDPNWTVSVTADTTNGALQIKAGGVINSIVRWAAYVKTIEIKY